MSPGLALIDRAFIQTAREEREGACASRDAVVARRVGWGWRGENQRRMETGGEVAMLAEVKGFFGERHNSLSQATCRRHNHAAVEWRDVMGPSETERYKPLQPAPL